MTRLLASVATIDEAAIVAHNGADLVDMKDPHRGALGALSTQRIREIVASLDRGVSTSATTGDQHTHSQQVLTAVEQVGATGVDYIKVALQPEFSVDQTCEILHPLCAQGLNIILVLFADDARVVEHSQHMILTAKHAGLHGVMIDTANKKAGGLRSQVSDEWLHSFVDAAKSHRLMTGLAGSLGETDIAPLLLLKPDYLGFRGALCDNTDRTHAICALSVKRIKLAFNRPVELIHTRVTRTGVAV